MSVMRVVAVALAMAAVAMSGCLSDDEPDDHFDDGHSHGDDGHAMMAQSMPRMLGDFRVGLQDCEEAGGISVYNSEEGAEGPTAPFLRANTKDDLGHPVIGTYMVPITSDWTTGIWHMAGQCASYSINGEPRDGEFRFGWVGVKVERPAYDLDGPERQYFITDLSFSDREVVETLRSAGIHATLLLEGGVFWLAPDVANIVMNDEDHGIFETHIKFKPYRDIQYEPLRFWLYIPADGDLSHGHSHDAGGVEGVRYQPVPLQLETRGSGQHMIADGTGWFSHSRTNHHGEGVNGASGNLPGLSWQGFDRTITLGQLPDVTFEETWLH